MKSQEIESPKILMIINEFPPTGESGVQRPLKFLKYLDRAGWQTFVVTPQKPSKTVVDHSLCKDIPARSRVYGTANWGFTGKATDKAEAIRAQTLERGSILKRILWPCLKIANDLLFPLDKQIGWVPFALLKSIYMIRRYRIRNVYITGYPFSAFLVGIALKRIFGNKIFWVADYRDSWQFVPLFEQIVLPFRQAIIRKWDDRVLKSCDRIVFVTDFIKKRYQQRFRWIEQKAVVITNGYDDEDFVNILPRQFERFTFLYMGKIYVNKGNPLPLLRAISRSQNPNIQYIHIGTIAPEVLAEIESGDFEFFHYEGYKSHQEALNYAAGADVNIIVNNDDEESIGVYTGKLFELIRLGKPILALGPRECIIKDLLLATHTGNYAYIQDEAEILANVNKLYQPQEFSPDLESTRAFSRPNLTAQLMKLYAKD